jgi:lipopolysaccharide/colanic/teichoic acid biosynthesis glycosyltransferase
VQALARFLTFVFPVVVVVGVQKAHAAWIGTPPYDLFPSWLFVFGLLYAAILALAAYGMGLPDVPVERGKALGVALGVSVAAAGIMSVLQLLAGQPLVGRVVIFGSAIVAVPIQLAASVLANSGRERAEARDRVVFVGRATEAAQLRDDLALAPERASTLVASLDDTAASVRDGRRPLVELVRRERAAVLVIDRTAQMDQTVIDQAAELHEGGVRVRTLLEFYEEWLAKLPLSELERESLFFDISEIHRVRYAHTKRILDLGCAVVSLIPLALAVPFVLLGNLLANRGPLLFTQDRVGRGGSTFKILKFRTMSPSTTAGGAGEWTAADDPRITPFGKFMRVTHVDELPQVINILKGELSMVGPRPEQPHYVAQLNELLPFYDMRHLVRPGLTGWAQVKYGYAADERDALQKLQYEFFYLRRQSVFFDLRILFRTIRSTLGGEGRGR